MDSPSLLPVVPIASLWLPIVVSAVLVFFASFLVWMVLPHHRTDMAKLPNEDEVMSVLRKSNVGQGNYAFPHCKDPAAMKDEAFLKKWETGPSGLLTIRPTGGFSMNKELGQWFVFLLVVCVLVAYVVGRTVLRVPGHDYMDVFRMAGTAAFLSYSVGVVPQGIWKSLRWSTVFKEVLDGLAYALLTAGAFGWLAA